jgi:hypothetical protein
VRRIWHWLRDPARRAGEGGGHDGEPKPHFGEDLVVG